MDQNLIDPTTGQQFLVSMSYVAGFRLINVLRDRECPCVVWSSYDSTSTIRDSWSLPQSTLKPPLRRRPAVVQS